MNIYGIVSKVNFEKGTVIVEFPDLGIPSDELIVFQGRTHGTKHYSMPEIGEIGLCLLNETGTSGYYLGAGYSEANPMPEKIGDGISLTVFNDGTSIIYDENTSKLYISVIKNTEIICPKIFIKGDLTIEGNIELVGKLEATEDVLASGISLKNHKTTGVVAGNDISGIPE